MSDRLKLAAAIGALVLLTIGSVAQAQTDACGSRKMSKKLNKPMAAIQEARDAKDWEQMLTKAREADAISAEKTPYEKFWIDEFSGIAQINLKQYPEAMRVLASALDSPCMDEADKPARTKLIFQLAYQIKDYPKAIEYGKRLTQAKPDADSEILLGNAYYISNDFENTRATMASAISKIEANGKTPDETAYRILQSACLNLKDIPCVDAQIENLVIHYPKPGYWQDLTNAMLRASKTDKELLNILRLADGAEILKEAAQLMEMAELALGQGLPGEAQAIIEKGTKQGIFVEARDKTRAAGILADARQAAALDKSTLEKQDASARAKPTGEADVKLGVAYLSYGDTGKATEAINRGIAKGGVKNPDEASLLLGIAYLRANNRPEAAKAFRAVQTDPMLTRIAKLWLLKAGSETATG